MTQLHGQLYFGISRPGCSDGKCGPSSAGARVLPLVPLLDYPRLDLADTATAAGCRAKRNGVLTCSPPNFILGVVQISESI